MNTNKIVAPQKSLQSSWMQIAFTKPKACNVIKRSLGNRPNTIIKTPKGMATSSNLFNSNPY